jgi:hypothetical protein
MTTLWIVAFVALAIAVLALTHSRRTARKLEHLTEMYWQLKLDHGEFKARADPPEAPAAQPRTTFVPLTRVAGLRPESGQPARGTDGPGSGSDT